MQPLQPLQKTQLQPPCGPSVGSLCHPCITTTHISYSVLSLKLPPPPCAVLLHGNILIIIIITTITTITITITILYVCLSIYISMLCSKFLAWIGTHTYTYMYISEIVLAHGFFKEPHTRLHMGSDAAIHNSRRPRCKSANQKNSKDLPRGMFS